MNFAAEYDLRPWQTYGQCGSNVEIFRLPDGSEWIVLWSGSQAFYSESVKEVCRFGKSFTIYEGAKERFFVDIMQTKMYAPKTLDFKPKDAPSFSKWKPDYDHWYQTFISSQGQRLENIKAARPLV